jgi:hypothetical protein
VKIYIERERRTGKLGTDERETEEAISRRVLFF